MCKNSFIPDISIAPPQVHYCSESLSTTAATVGFENANLRTQGTDLTTEPSCHTKNALQPTRVIMHCNQHMWQCTATNMWQCTATNMEKSHKMCYHSQHKNAL